MLDRKILNIIGFLLLLGIIYYLITKIKKATDTKLYSEDAIEDLQDIDKLRKLDDAIISYHKNGKWEEPVLN